MGNFYEDLDLKPTTDEELGFRNRERVSGYFSRIYLLTLAEMMLGLMASATPHLNILSAVCYCVVGITLFYIGSSEQKSVGLYTVAGIGQVLSGASMLLKWYMEVWGIPSLTAGIIMLVGAIISAIVCIAGGVCEGKAYAKTIEALDWTMAEKWNIYVKLYIASMVGMIGFIVLYMCDIMMDSVFAVILSLAFVILMLVVVLMKPFYLSKTIKILEKK